MASQQSESQPQLEYDIDEAVQQEEEENFTSLFEQDDTDEDSEDTKLGCCSITDTRGIETQKIMVRIPPVVQGVIEVYQAILPG